VTGDVKAIARENALPGTGAWLISNAAASSQFAAYSNQESYPAGSDVSISVSANPAGQFTWRGFRMGGYGGEGGRLYAEGRAVAGGGGRGGRLYAEAGRVSAPPQASPSFDSATGLVRAGWPATFSFST